MDINVNVKVSGDPELMTTLATLVQCIQDVLHVSNSQLAAAEAEENTVPVTVPAEPPKPVPEPVAIPEAPAAPEPVQPASAVPTAPVAAVPVVPTAPAKTYTWAEIQTACAPLIDNGTSQKALLALLPKYGVDSLMNIKPERYGELVLDLRALGAKL